MRILIAILCLVVPFLMRGQFVVLSPNNATASNEVTLTFDASLGNKELLTATKIYIHHGVVTDKADGVDWKNVKGNWGKDDGIGLMTKITGTSKWTIKFGPTLRQYFGLSSSDNVFRISCVFRNADGSKKGTIAPGAYPWGTVTSNQDIYINLAVPSFVSIDAPAGNDSYINKGEGISIKANASALASSIKLFINEGNGFNQVASKTNTSNLTYDYVPQNAGNISMKVEAIISGQTVSSTKQHNIVFNNTNTIKDLPSGVVLGVNYNDTDPTKATLVLEAPKKDFVYVIGDMNNWQVSSNYLMNKTPDGNFFWIELNNLEIGKKYVYQYLINGTLSLADPFSEIIVDPDNDKFIETDVYPNIPAHTKPQNGIASILQTNQPKYNWSNNEGTWKKPNADHMVIYELHLRDFIGKHDYKTLTDTIQYIKRLGVNAIEFMPLGEFEGNDSWGYNPSFHMALDKYYGQKNDLKALIDVCHQNGMAAILDIVFNHAFSQSPLVKMYADGNLTSADNPWFNRNYVGPFVWGYDFNHESKSTERFVDRVNKYWLEEYHFDGFRFDFTKGFTNNAPNNSLDNYDASRIAILQRMISEIRKVKQDAIVILEHFGQETEENILATYGAKMWRNRSYDYVPAANGANTGSFNGMNRTTHVSYFNSHDERRIVEHMINEGQSKADYDIKRKVNAVERSKLVAAFTYLLPGPKMIWQFDELAYDIDINYNGRVGRKPYPWGIGNLGYYEDTQRKEVYQTYVAIMKLRNSYTPEKMFEAITNHQLDGEVRRLVYQNNGDDMMVIGNFSTKPLSTNPRYTQSGIWYDYITGKQFTINDVNETFNLKPGEWRIFTTKKYSDGFDNLYSPFENPVTITPASFTKNENITIKFDAKKASKFNTQGLVGAKKVYMHAGVVKSPGTEIWSNIVGNKTDDGIGLMTNFGNDIWEIKINPFNYFSLQTEEEISQIAMYFRDENDINIGKGFKDSDIYYNVESNNPFVTITPAKYDANTEITITFNAAEGNKELLGQEKIYMHSSVGIIDTKTPADNAWGKVVGNWGKDDGIGKMTRIGSTNLYQIKLIPKNYYGLTASEYPFWLAAVFRSADGSRKGTGNPGPLNNGFIASNQDFFFKNGQTTNTYETTKNEIILYPNPNNGIVNFSNSINKGTFHLYDTKGLLIFKSEIDGSSLVLPQTSNGLFFFTIDENGKSHKGSIILNR